MRSLSICARSSAEGTAASTALHLILRLFDAIGDGQRSLVLRGGVVRGEGVRQPAEAFRQVGRPSLEGVLLVVLDERGKAIQDGVEIRVRGAGLVAEFAEGLHETVVGRLLAGGEFVRHLLVHVGGLGEFAVLVRLLGLGRHDAFASAHQDPGCHADADEQDDDADHERADDQAGALAGRPVVVGFFGGRRRRDRGGRRLRRRVHRWSRRLPTSHGRRLPRSRRQLTRRRLRRCGGVGRAADGRRLLPRRRRPGGGGSRIHGLRLDERYEVADGAGSLAVVRGLRRRRRLRGHGEHLAALRVGAAHRLAAQGFLHLVTGFTGRTDGGDQHGCHPRTRREIPRSSFYATEGRSGTGDRAALSPLAPVLRGEGPGVRGIFSPLPLGERGWG